ncbi:PAS domain-containing sensor histidine kinase [Longimicrobium sp.]|uniref:PAS domain-containing sensor histidine kinase n=1 Tax=Longimicrobium sp. TaxID=2029185 RepID=UPI002CC29475|nr:ATP-binding protein [Longimicrobium sp.]HSU14822.1 ATP-binding protein [Longimicrobium sp.]
MNFEPPFQARINDARARVAVLRRRVEESGRAGDSVLGEAVDELLAALEELEVSDEELRAQNETLAATQLLVEAERQRYADLFHFAPDPYLVTGSDGTVREANRAAAALLAVAERSFPGKPLSVFVARNEVRGFREQVNRAARGHRVDSFEVTLVPRDGDPVRVACTVEAAAHPGPDGPALRWLLRDVTERRRADEAESRAAAEHAARRSAEEAHQRLAAVLEATTDGFYSLDPAWRFTYVNGSAERLWGRERAGLLGRGFWEAFPDAAGSPAEPALRGAMEGRRVERVEVLSPQLGRWIELLAFPTGDGVSVFFHDVEERHRSEAGEHLLAAVGEALSGELEVEEMLRRLARAAAGRVADWCVVHVHDDGRLGACGIAHADPALGGPLEETLHRVPLDPAGPNPVCVALRTGLPALLAGTDEVLEAAFPDPVQRSEARAMGAESALVVPMQARGRTLGVITLVRGPGEAYGPDDLALAGEIARRAALAVDNARLYHAARAATRAREEVLAVVSHDLRNPLNAVLLAAIILDEYSDAERWNERERQQVRTIRNAAEQMGSLIHDLVEVVALESGARVLHLDRVEPAKAMHAAAEMYHGLASEKGIALTVDAGADVPDVRADRARLLQVLSNLLGNALKFTPGGGSVTIGAARSGDAAVGFYVADTGPGVDPHDLPRLFERFWQGQRGGGLGLGLGLAIAKGIVDAHGGRIWVDSSPGRGSTFFFTLPTQQGDG